MALIKCPDCDRDVSDQAASCPNCGYPLNSPEKAPAPDPSTAEAGPPPAAGEMEAGKKGGCLKSLLVLLLVAFLIGVGLLLEKDFPKISDVAPLGEVTVSTSKEDEYVSRMGREKYEAEMEKIRLIPRLTVVQLIRFFEANEIAADKQYKGQEVIIIGVVADISKSMLGVPKISFSANGRQKKLVAALKRSQEDQAAGVGKGDRVSLKAVVTRSMMGKVGLKNGTFFDEYDPLAGSEALAD